MCIRDSLSDVCVVNGRGYESAQSAEALSSKNTEKRHFYHIWMFFNKWCALWSKFYEGGSAILYLTLQQGAKEGVSWPTWPPPPWICSCSGVWQRVVSTGSENPTNNKAINIMEVQIYQFLHNCNWDRYQVGHTVMHWDVSTETFTTLWRVNRW